MNSRQVSRIFNTISEIVKCALVLALVTAALSFALWRALGINPFAR